MTLLEDILVNCFREHKVGGNIGDVLKHDVLCDNMQGLNFQGASELFFVTLFQIQ